MDEIINQSRLCIIGDHSKDCVGIEIQMGYVSSAEYVDSTVATNGDFFVTVVNKGTETDSECHQLIVTLCETISLLKDELNNKQVTINNLVDITSSCAVLTHVDTIILTNFIRFWDFVIELL